MAGRLVVLEFEDRDAAEAFVRNRHQPEHLGYRVGGMYILPDKFCECAEKNRKNVKNWRRGSRTGLQICINCRRPSSFHNKGIWLRLQHLFGYNLLTPKEEG